MKGKIGRPALYGEPMMSVSTRIPVSAFDCLVRAANRQHQSINERLRLLVLKDVQIENGRTGQ